MAAREYNQETAGWNGGSWIMAAPTKGFVPGTACYTGCKAKRVYNRFLERHIFHNFSG